MHTLPTHLYLPDFRLKRNSVARFRGHSTLQTKIQYSSQLKSLYN